MGYTARDLTLEAARDVGPRKTPSRPSLPPAQIKKLLDSRHEREVLDGLRRVIALQYAHPPQPTLTYFPAVLKTLSTPYPSTRPLVYNYLLHHAELDPDTALLSINTIQKSLSDSNARIRAMALKTMSGIQVPVISQIVSLAIKKGISDLSPLVRKAAALACVKCVRLDASTRPQIEEYLAQLLADKQYYVAGAAVQAFMEVCPERIDLIHPVYRRLCRMCVDMDEWGQIALTKMMNSYARKCFPRRTKRIKRSQTREEKARVFYEEPDAPYEDDKNDDDYEDVDVVVPDLELFLTSIKPLLHSRNSAVLLAVTKSYLILAPTTHLPLAIDPLIALLRSPQDIQEVALANIVQVCLRDPQLFVPHIRHFLLRSTDAAPKWKLKLEVLTLTFPLVGKEMQTLVLAELEHFSRSHDAELVRESVKAIGRCAHGSSPVVSRRCLALLLRQIHSPDQHLVGEAIEVVRQLIQRNPEEHRRTTVVRLAKNLDSLTSAKARASVIWLIGEYAAPDGEQGVAVDVLRILVKEYKSEASQEVKGQILLLGARCYLHWLNAKNSGKADEGQDGTKMNGSGAENGEDHGDGSQKTPPIEALYTYLLHSLARYTPSYDLRDRARLYRALLTNNSSTDLASLLLLAPKPVPQAPSPSEKRKDLVLGSASLVVGEKIKRCDSESDWVKEGEEPDPKLREDGEVIGRRSGEGSAGRMLDEALGQRGAEVPMAKVASAKGKSLDDWLAEKSGEESVDEESEEDEDEDEVSEEESSEYESESDDDAEETGDDEEDEVNEKSALVR